MGVDGVRPIRKEPSQRIAETALRRPRAGHGQDGLGCAEQADVAKHVLPVLAAHHDEMSAARVLERHDRKIGDARVVIAPLGRQQVDDIDALTPSLKERGRWGDEVDVAIGRDPPIA